MAGKWVLIGVAAVVLGVGAGALSMHWKRPASAPAQKSAAALIAPNSEVTVSGKLRPQHIVTVPTSIDGAIDSFQADVGQDVYEGQVLARIGASGLESQRDAAANAVSAAESDVARAETSVASARLEASRAEADEQRSRSAFDKMRAVYERQQTLIKAGATPRVVWEKAQKDYDTAKADYDLVAKAARLSAEQLQVALNGASAAQKTLQERNQQLAEAQNNIQSAEVRSPVDGTIVGRNGEVGKPAGADLFEIATDMFALEVPLEPKPEILKQLRPGQPAMVLILDLQSAGMPGQIKEIKDNQVIVEFNCTLEAVRPGMPVDVRFQMQ